MAAGRTPQPRCRRRTPEGKTTTLLAAIIIRAFLSSPSVPRHARHGPSHCRRGGAVSLCRRNGTVKHTIIKRAEGQKKRVRKPSVHCTRRAAAGTVTPRPPARCHRARHTVIVTPSSHTASQREWRKEAAARRDGGVTTTADSALRWANLPPSCPYAPPRRRPQRRHRRPAAPPLFVARASSLRHFVTRPSAAGHANARPRQREIRPAPKRRRKVADGGVTAVTAVTGVTRGNKSCRQVARACAARGVRVCQAHDDRRVISVLHARAALNF